MSDIYYEEEPIEHVRYWKEWKYGETITGEYLGRDVPLSYQRIPYRLKVLKTEFDTTTEINEGDILLLNECSLLNQQMKKVSEGDIVKVTYKGTRGDGEKALTQITVVKCNPISSKTLK